MSGQTTVVVTGKFQSGTLAFDDLERRRAAEQTLAVRHEAAFRARLAAH